MSSALGGFAAGPLGPRSLRAGLPGSPHARSWPARRLASRSLMAVARCARSARGEDDRLVLDVLVDALGPELAAHPRLLEAAERAAEVEDQAGVDRDATRAHARTEVGGVIGVGRPHRAAQAVRRVVGDRDGVGFV